MLYEGRQHPTTVNPVSIDTKVLYCQRHPAAWEDRGRKRGETGRYLPLILDLALCFHKIVETNYFPVLKRSFSQEHVLYSAFLSDK